MSEENLNLEKRLEELTEQINKLSKLIDTNKEYTAIEKKGCTLSSNLSKRIDNAKLYTKNKIFDNPFGFVAGAGLITGFFGLVAGIMIGRKK